MSASEPPPAPPAEDAAPAPASGGATPPTRAAPQPWRNPLLVSALAAIAVRAAASSQSWVRNPLVSRPGLDGAYYLRWAADIGSGDLLGRGGLLGGEPFLLNPLYAYALAPLSWIASGSAAPVLVMQALLAGGTAALTASAARRMGGALAGWIAGLAVAFSAALVHLDAHVAVSGLAAFLVAVCCWSVGRSGLGHAPEPGGTPLALGVQAGVTALARPVALLALPFFAWLHGGRLARSWRGGLVVLVAFGAVSALPLARNWAVSGERVVYTAANGLNLHLGNNPAARRLRTMVSYDFRFAPEQMHADARYRVAHDLGRKPTRSEVSDWYADRARDELADATGASLSHYLDKLRWFFSSTEPASSADFELDRELAPWMRYGGFLPTWLLVAAAGAGLLLCRDRRDALLGPGALVLAHWGACTLAFPLEHYRSPAIPALAVLAGLGVARMRRHIANRSFTRPALGCGVTVVLAIAGTAGRQPGRPESLRLTNAALGETQLAVETDDPVVHRDALDRAQAAATEAHRLEPESPWALGVLEDVAAQRGAWGEARSWALRRLSLQPWNPIFRARLVELDLRAGRDAEALEAVELLAADFPWSVELDVYRRDVRDRLGLD